MTNTTIDSAYGRELKKEDFASIDSKENFFTASFSPEHPRIGDRFKANGYIYQSYSPGAVSLFGRSFHDGEWAQFSIVLRGPLSDGKHPITNDGVGVSAALVHSTGGEVNPAHKGEIDLHRNLVTQTIDATFNFTFIENGVEYQVTDGKLFLNATGPV